MRDDKTYNLKRRQGMEIFLNIVSVSLMITAVVASIITGKEVVRPHRGSLMSEVLRLQGGIPGLEGPRRKLHFDLK